MDTKTILSEASDRMQKTIEHLEEELLNIRAGKASPTVLNGVFVDYYGSQTPISGVASVTVPDAKTILIQPWDKNLIRAIEKAIIDSNIGLTPSNNGEQIRLSIPVQKLISKASEKFYGLIGKTVNDREKDALKPPVVRN